MPDVESFWHSLEEAYQAILSAPSFDAWIKTTRPLKLDNNQLWLEVPSAVHRDYWEKNLSAKIVETGFKLTGAEVMPHFVVADEKDAALAQALGLTKEDVTIDVLDEGKKGFLGLGKKLAQISMEPTISEQVTEAVEETVEDIVVADEAKAVEEAVEELTEAIPSLSEESTHSLENLEDEAAITELAMYLTNISNELNAPAMVRIARENGNIIFHLETEKQGILIGKHGKVLNALQYLAQVFIHRIASNKLSIVVNVGNYREKRHEILERLAKRTAEKAKRTGRPVFLEPMPAFERKQIHHTLSKDEQIKTHSEGDEPYRYLVVEPVKKYF